MPNEPFLWPTIDDYDLAMQHLDATAVDGTLRTAKVAEDPMDTAGILRLGGAGLYTCTYKVTTPATRSTPSNTWVIRCFCSNPGHKVPNDIRVRYQKISDFCRANQHKVSALLPVTYVEQGLRVQYIDDVNESLGEITIASRMETVPIVKIPFIKAMPLGDYIAVHHNDAHLMEVLCIAWVRMMDELEAVEMAHGDLDLTNVLVVESGSQLTLKLIDYDNMWIPALRSSRQTEFGHEEFQHPYFLQIKNRAYDAHMDRFSAFIIYLSIRALIYFPELYDTWGADDTHRLLFSRQDYEQETQPAPVTYISRITQLRSKNVEVLNPYLDELSASLREKRMPCALRAVPLPVPMMGASAPLVSYGKEQPKAPPTTPTIPSTQPDSATQQQETVFDTRQRQAVHSSEDADRSASLRTRLIVGAVIVAIIILAIIWWVVTYHAPTQTTPSSFLLSDPHSAVLQVHEVALMIKGAIYVGT